MKHFSKLKPRQSAWRLCSSNLALASSLLLTTASFGADTKAVEDTFSTITRGDQSQSIREMEADFRSEGETIRQPAGYLDGIRDSTDDLNRGSGRLYWDTPPFPETWGNCDARTPTCGSCGTTARTSGTDYDYRTVTCESTNLNGTTGTWGDNLCTQTGLSKPSEVQTKACTKSKYCGDCPPPEDDGGGGSTGVGSGGSAYVGQKWTISIYICSSSDSGYYYSTDAGNFRSRVINHYRSFNAVDRCPERGGYEFWLDKIAEEANANYGGDQYAAWENQVKDAMDEIAKAKGETNYYVTKNIIDSKCDSAAKSRYGSSVEAEYDMYSGNECVVTSN